MIETAYRRTFLACLALAGPAVAKPPTTGPATPPAMRERVTGAAYDARFKAALGEPLPDPKEPDEGVAVAAVTAGGAGDAAGLKVGDVVVSADGVAVGNPSGFVADHEVADGPEPLVVWSPSTHAVRPVTLVRGELGMRLAARSRLSLWYARGLAAGEQPSDEMRVAARAASADVELAETALSHAAAAGVAGPRFDALAAVVCYDDLRLDAALAYATRAAAGPLVQASDRVVADRVTYRAGVATYRWPLAQRAAADDPAAVLELDRYNSGDGATLGDAIRAAADLPAGDGPDRPRAAFDRLAVVDHTGQLKNVIRRKQEDHSTSTNIVDNLQRFKRSPFDLPGNTYEHSAIGPSGADVDALVHCKFHRTDDHHSNWTKGVSIAIQDEAHPGNDDPNVVGLFILGDAPWGCVSGQGLPTAVLDLTGRVADDRHFTVGLTVVGRWCGVTVDGRPVYRGPVPAASAGPGRRLCLTLQAVGVTGSFHNVQWRTAGGTPP